MTNAFALVYSVLLTSLTGVACYGYDILAVKLDSKGTALRAYDTS